MVGELTIAQRINLIALLWTVVKGDMSAMGQQLRSLSEPFRPVDDAAFVREFERKMARYGKGSGADFKDILNAGMAVLRDNGLRLDPSLTLAMKAMMQASAFFAPLAPADRTFTAAAVEIVLEQAQAPSTEVDGQGAGRARRPRRLAGQAAHAAPEYLKSLVSWNNQFKKGKLTVVRGHLVARQADGRGPVDREHGGDRPARRGGIIGSAIAASALAGHRQPRWSSTPRSGFFGSFVLGLVLVDHLHRAAVPRQRRRQTLRTR